MTVDCRLALLTFQPYAANTVYETMFLQDHGPT